MTIYSVWQTVFEQPMKGKSVPFHIQVSVTCLIFPKSYISGDKNPKPNQQKHQQTKPTQTNKPCAQKAPTPLCNMITNPYRSNFKLTMLGNEKTATLWIVWGQILPPLNRILEIQMLAFTKCQTIRIVYKVEIEDS